MQDKPLISIITPTYNHEKYIEKCISSVLSQTYQNWEQIIIDDGSTDNTEKIVTSYKDKRIKYFKQENLGIHNLYKNYNKALELSNGDYIAILEGDDFWPNYKLEKQIKVFEKESIVLACGNARIVTDGKIEKLLNKPNSIPNILPKYKNIEMLLLKNFIPACTVICKKQTLVKTNGFNQPLNSPCVDYSTWLQISKYGDFYYENDVMGYWRTHKGQASSEYAFEMYEHNIKYTIDFFKSLSINEKKMLTININDIKKSKNELLAQLNFNLGREYLSKKKWKKSREHFKSALKGNKNTKSFSIFGIICSFLKTDIELIITLFEKIRNYLTF